jgi:hypothetical protein
LPDTLFTQGQKIVCTVKEVTDYKVSYVHPGEEALYSIAVHKLEKIAFASGRVQTFTPPNPIKPLEWNAVRLTTQPHEIDGLTYIGRVSVTAKGMTPLSGTQRVRERAERKLSYWATMLGGDVVLITDINVQGIRGLTRAQTSIGGVVYSRKTINIAEFNKGLRGEINFVSSREIYFSNATRWPNIRLVKIKFQLIEVFEKNGQVLLKGLLDGGPLRAYRLIHCDKKYFFLQTERGHKIVNLRFLYGEDNGMPRL